MKEKIGRALLFVTGIIVTGVLSSLIKDLWEAPSPFVEITDVEFKTTPNASQTTLPPSLLTLIQDHTYFPDLEAEVSLSQIEKALSIGKKEQRRWLDALERLNILNNMLLSLGALPVDEQRKRFLERWYAGDLEEVLDPAFRTILERHPLSANYASYPRNYPRRIQFVDYGIGLEPTDERGKTGQALRLVQVANLQRRVWAHFRHQELMIFMESIKEEVERVVQKHKAITEQLLGLINSNTPKGVVVTLIVSNRGRRPFALRKLGILSMQVPNVSDSMTSLVQLELTGPSAKEEAQTENVLIVEGGETITMTLYSRESLTNIIKSNETLLGGEEDWPKTQKVDDSRLVRLFNASAGGLAASVSLAVAGVRIEDAKLGPSPLMPFGKAARGNLLTILKQP